MSAQAGAKLYRFARMVCPRAERRWLDAMFAELPSIEDGHDRGSWAVGAAGILAAVLRLRASSVVPPLLWGALAVSLSGVVVFAIGSRSDFEGGGMDDDVFYRFAWLAGVAVVGFGLVAIVRIFSTYELPRRH